MCMYCSKVSQLHYTIDEQIRGRRVAKLHIPLLFCCGSLPLLHSFKEWNQVLTTMRRLVYTAPHSPTHVKLASDWSLAQALLTSETDHQQLQRLDHLMYVTCNQEEIGTVRDSTSNSEIRGS
jgi:hypothetical protein